MLVLSRGVQQSVVIDESVVVSVVSIGNGRVRLSIKAPREVSVRRSELPRRRSDDCGDGLAALAVAEADAE